MARVIIPTRDATIREIEGRIMREVNPVRHMAEPDAVDDIADRAAEHATDGDPQTRVPLRQGTVVEDQHTDHDDPIQESVVLRP